MEEARIYAKRELLTQLKQKYPETGGLTFTGVIDWALRKLIEEA